ncbi:hypothetical protein [Mycolicibacterium komossense]|uniref:Uncharacterized protein n=1 Tax=Mycolicibacterium komossense TaxID=1779 RepID=A0ABT3CE70_9MYCO|nr:hypothetical protein [Mycolicibacterium komossense]MCV7227789.1 hypothetical protein [Mycolicibacterium komossense]
MKKLIFASAVAGSLLGLAAGTAAQAVAAPAGAGSALQSSGYQSVLNKNRGAQLELCTVDSTKPNRTTDIRLNNVVLQPAYLTAHC